MQSKSPLFALLLLGAVLSSLKNAQQKYDFLLKETLKNEHGVVYLDEKLLSKYLYEFPRDYDLFVFITTHNCMYCKTIEEPFLRVAQAYKARQTYYPLRLTNGDIRRPIFFVHSHVGYHSPVFTGNFKIKSYPNIYFSQADEIFITEEFEKQNYMDINFWRITITDVIIDDAKIIEWCNKHSLYDVQLQRSVLGFFKLVAAVFTILLALGTLFYYAEVVVLNEKLWLIGSLAIYVVSAGGVYSVLHSHSPFVGQKKGQVEIIMTGTRNQYGIEGLIVVGSIFVIGFCLIAFSKVLRRHFDNNVVKFVILFILLQITITTVTWLEEVFKSKNFYSPFFLPPNYYIRGDFFTKDQGNIQ
jgi:hypothetical protein